MRNEQQRLQLERYCSIFRHKKGRYGPTPPQNEASNGFSEQAVMFGIMGCGKNSIKTCSNTSHTDMQVNRYKYFRWTPRTGFLTTLYVFVIPGIVGYIGWKWDVSFPLFHLLSYEPNIISSIRAPGTSEQSAGEISSPSAKRGRPAEGKCTYLDEKGASKTDTKQAVRGGYTTEPFLGCKIRMMCFVLVTGYVIIA